MLWEGDGERYEAQEQEIPRVSVVIATRNRPRDIVRAVDSVLRGTEQRCEVVVVDQSDSDATQLALHAAYGAEARIC